MKASYSNTDFSGQSIKVKGETMSVADFIALGGENCPMCGTDELDFYERQPHMSNGNCTARYECPNCSRKYTWDGTGPENGYGKSLRMAIQSAKNNWNEWARKTRRRMKK